jgi:hypothetical protein
LRYRAGVVAWRLLHGGARRLGPVRRQDLDAADAAFQTMFGAPFAVFEHASTGAEAPFLSALEAASLRYSAEAPG